MQKKQLLILEKALKAVPFEGWSNAVLRDAAKSAGLDKNYAQIAFKNGAIDAVSLFLQQIDARTYAALDKGSLQNMKIRMRIFSILRERFTVMKPYKAAIRKTIQFLTMPHHIPAAMKLAWNMADNVWYHAGDNSTDFNYYTKRSTLMAVYSSTLLYWLDDESGDLESTLDFLQRRIDNVMQFESAKQKLMQAIGFNKNTA